MKLSSVGGRMMAAGNNCFEFLDGILNVLVIEPDMTAREHLYRPLFFPFTCCNVTYVRSNTDALQVLRSGRRFHVCITELGMRDVEHDQFFILRHDAFQCSILVVTASSSAADGAQAMVFGARAVIDKDDDFDQQRFYALFRRMVLINVVNRHYNEWLTDTLTMATRILFEKNPYSVTEWADNMKITDRQLRNLWHSESGFGAKQVLFLYHVIRDALLFYEALFFGDINNECAVQKFFKKQYRDYYTAHREAMTLFLS